MRTDAPERLVFTQTVEALFVRGVAGRVSPTTQARLKQGGIDLGRPLLPAYAADVFTNCIAILAQELCPGQPGAAAYHFLGLRTVLGLEETLVGRASMALARLVGPLRALQTFPKGLKSGSTYSNATVKVVSPTTIELHVTGYALPYPDFQIGTVIGLFQIIHRPAPVCEVLDFNPQQETLSLRVSW